MSVGTVGRGGERRIKRVFLEKINIKYFQEQEIDYLYFSKALTRNHQSSDVKIIH